MDDDALYRELQRHLDRMPVPYPASETGVEIRILKQLFTPEEAHLALCLSTFPESPKTIHRRMRHAMNREQLAEALDRMAEKGSIRKVEDNHGPRYSKAPLVLGMYEAQVNQLTPELERDVRAYFHETFAQSAMYTHRTPQMRTVPVHKSIEVERAVANYDDIRKFVEASPGPFAALNCICRQGKDLTGEPCRQTKERQNCLMIGGLATMMIEKRSARPISRDEMLELLERADRDGLVLEPQNAREPLFICCCCGCCCGVLTTAKRLPRPADFFQTDFVAEVCADGCQICGMCETRCQMDAIVSGDEVARVASERCIGCGLCVTTCPSGAVRLRRKEGRKAPPKDTQALYGTIFQERFGRLRTAAAMAGHLVGRKF